MHHSSIIVRAAWDKEARVWFATSSDIDGLTAEADSYEGLKDKIIMIISELIELNGFIGDMPEIPVHILSEQMHRIQNPHVI